MAKQRRRDEIVCVACKLFSEKGYQGTTTRDISEACGILAGSLYAHIDTKEDLLFEIANQGAKAFLEALTPISQQNIPSSEKLREGLKAHIQIVDQNIDAATVFFHEWKALSKERREIIQRKRDRYENLWTSIIEGGIREGEFRPIDEKFARYLFLSVGNWLYAWYRPNGELAADEIADRFSSLILCGLNQ